jgi:hypothetical protein
MERTPACPDRSKAIAITLRTIKPACSIFIIIGLLLGFSAFPQSAAPTGRTITLKSKATGLFVTAWGFEPSVDVRSSAYSVETRAEFDVVDAGGSLIALRSHSNNTYWTARGANPDIKIVSSSPDTDSWTKFSWIKNSDGTISLKAPNGKYVSVVESDTTMVPGIDSALLKYSETLKKTPGYDSNQSSRPVITPEMRKPIQYKVFCLRARSPTIGIHEKFGMEIRPFVK